MNDKTTKEPDFTPLINVFGGNDDIFFPFADNLLGNDAAAGFEKLRLTINRAGFDFTPFPAPALSSPSLLAAANCGSCAGAALPTSSEDDIKLLAEKAIAARGGFDTSDYGGSEERAGFLEGFNAAAAIFAARRGAALPVVAEPGQFAELERLVTEMRTISAADLADPNHHIRTQNRIAAFCLEWDKVRAALPGSGSQADSPSPVGEGSGDDRWKDGDPGQPMSDHALKHWFGEDGAAEIAKGESYPALPAAPSDSIGKGPQGE